MTTIGALIGLALAIFLIIKKLSPTYSLMIGALVGALAGGLSITDSVTVMTDGVKDITPAVIRILAAGVLSGALIASGAAVTLSNAIIRIMGKRFTLAAIALTTMILTGVGVFIDVAVITVAPIALAAGKQLRLSPAVILMAMIGGGKCGNIISPNPNTIIAAQNMGADLSMTMLAGVLPAIIGLLFTIFIILRFMPHKEATTITPETDSTENDETYLPSLPASLIAPIVTIALLALRPLLDINIDPLIALPIGGLAGMLAMRQRNKILPAMEVGLKKMTSVAVLLIGTGTIAGVIKNSGLKDIILSSLDSLHLGGSAIAPVAGALMSAATASTTAGATIASASFGDAILSVGIPAMFGAAMINAGATVLDHLPHGSFFHATGGVCGLTFNERLRLIPYECAVGAVLALMSVVTYLLFN
ncbi:MAG: GntP family permease [Muribaculaceae bacterium]|nr:GntP family permease [Muribaculaceae bacterium]